MNSLLSIVIPAYNVENYIEKCIDSILNQDYKEIEIIIINNGSTDNTMDILRKYENKHSRINILDIGDSDAAKARNIGISLSKGKYITFVDADDWVENKCYKNIVCMLDKKDADIGVFSYRFKYEDIKPDYNIIYNEEEINLNSKYNEYDKLKKINGEVWNKIYRLDYIKKYNVEFNSENGVYGEDILFNLLLYYNKPKIVVNPILGYNHLVRSNSLTQSKRDRLVYRFITILDYICEVFSDESIIQFGDILINYINSFIKISMIEDYKYNRFNIKKSVEILDSMKKQEGFKYIINNVKPSSFKNRLWCTIYRYNIRYILVLMIYIQYIIKKNKQVV